LDSAQREDALHLTGLDRLFWALSFIENCVLLIVLFGRRRATSLPVFTTLIATNIFRTIVLYFTLRYGTSGNYFYTYWTLALLDTALQLALAYELATHVFQPLGAWAADVRQSLMALIVVSLILAAGLTWLAAPPTKTMRLAIVIRGDLFSSALMTELFVVMIALSVSFGLPWRTHVSRVAQGYGIYSLNGMLTDAAHGYLGSSTYKLLSQMQIGLYIVCLLYWIVTLAMNEPAPRKMPEKLHEDLRALQRRAALILQSLRTLGSTS
jgi:hypothetical protein